MFQSLYIYTAPLAQQLVRTVQVYISAYGSLAAPLIDMWLELTYVLAAVGYCFFEVSPCSFLSIYLVEWMPIF